MMEKDSFEQVIRKMRGGWLRLGLQFFGGSDSDAQDALQETLLRLWVVRSRLHSEGEVQALGTRIMKNECINIYRRQRHLSDAPLPDTPACEAHPLDKMEAAEQHAILQRAVARLPQNARCLLQLHLYEEMTLDEIAAATGKTKGAVKTMITRSKQQIASWIKTST